MSEAWAAKWKGSGSYPRCRVTGCRRRATEEGSFCPLHTNGSGGRTAPSAAQMAGAADVLRRFAGSRELSPSEAAIITNAADLVGMAALAEGSRRV